MEANSITAASSIRLCWWDYANIFVCHHIPLYPLKGTRIIFFKEYFYCITVRSRLSKKSVINDGARVWLFHFVPCILNE